DDMSEYPGAWGRSKPADVDARPPRRRRPPPALPSPAPLPALARRATHPLRCEAGGMSTDRVPAGQDVTDAGSGGTPGTSPGPWTGAEGDSDQLPREDT